MNIIYEMLIRFDENGNFKGAHQQVRDDKTGVISTVPITPIDWETVVPNINSALLTKATEFDTLQTKHNELETKHNEVISAAEFAKSTGNTATLNATLQNLLSTEKEKQIAKVREEIAIAQVKLTELENSPIKNDK